MARIALIHISQETNDFNPEPTTLRDYESFGLLEGAQILDRLRGVGQVGGYLDAIESSGMDGLALQLHGACAAEGLDDVEGAQVELCRAILGRDVPIVLGLDHHANVT